MNELKFRFQILLINISPAILPAKRNVIASAWIACLRLLKHGSQTALKSIYFIDLTSFDRFDQQVMKKMRDQNHVCIFRHMQDQILKGAECSG